MTLEEKKLRPSLLTYFTDVSIKLENIFLVNQYTNTHETTLERGRKPPSPPPSARLPAPSPPGPGGGGARGRPEERGEARARNPSPGRGAHPSPPRRSVLTQAPGQSASFACPPACLPSEAAAAEAPPPLPSVAGGGSPHPSEPRIAISQRQPPQRRLPSGAGRLQPHGPHQPGRLQTTGPPSPPPQPLAPNCTLPGSNPTPPSAGTSSVRPLVRGAAPPARPLRPSPRPRRRAPSARPRPPTPPPRHYAREHAQHSHIHPASIMLGSARNAAATPPSPPTHTYTTLPGSAHSAATVAAEKSGPT
ncbi:vegetative cell wall protein gp1-like [Gracilinanus agilis]|uniref:vegetative cell wall protein gp1-like n=1 Tax=Gracilinanus agilis TaxID=191870 RepID=UPI001CFF3171|nr:vegetative cell wall protein gp1-like [Gracilinanus agilis]